MADLMHTPALFLISATAAVALTACSVDVDLVDTTRRTETTSVPADGVTAIAFDTDNGAIEVRGVAPDSSEADAITIESIFDESEPGSGESTITTDGGRVSVSGACDSDFLESCAVGFRVVVPASIRVAVETDNGDVKLMSLDGTIDAVSDNGEIIAIDLRAGELRANTSNGDVDIAFAGVPLITDVRTGNGAVAITVPDDGRGYRVDADSDNGDVDVDLTITDEPDAERTIIARSDNGDVTITAG